MNFTERPVDVTMRVNADRRRKPCKQVWNWFGYDEPNYTDTANGKKLLAELAELGQPAPRIRTHNLLTSGDGTPALKWGSTDAYREKADGTPDYYWGIMDRLFDTWVEAGVVPFIQVGFTPQPLSNDPGPYQHSFSVQAHTNTITTGWTAPPNDLAKWSGLIGAWAEHLVGRYGAERVREWPWEMWNEPDGLYWTGSVPQFCALYDTTSAAIRRAIPEARFGGPHTCGPFHSERAAAFLREFLEHCTQTFDPAVSGPNGPLDFIAFHAKGKPEVFEGNVRMGVSDHLNNIQAGLDIVNEYERFSGLPVIVGESDPEGCAACPSSVHPQNAYRNGPLYGVYVVETMMRSLEIAERAGREFEGLVTWAFLFEDQPWFAGFRDLATNGVDKAVLNCFRLLGLLRGDYVDCSSTGRLDLDDILSNGVRSAPDIDVVATRDDKGISILCWNYHDDDVAGPDGRISLEIAGVPQGYRAWHFRVDGQHSNAYNAWQQMGEPQQIDGAGLKKLQEAAGLAELETPKFEYRDGVLVGELVLPRRGVSAIRLEF